MKHHVSLLAGLAFCLSCSWTSTAAIDSKYQSILDRNPFALMTETEQPPVPPAIQPLHSIKLVGISEFHGEKFAWLAISSIGPNRRTAYILVKGKSKSHDCIQLLNISEAGEVDILYAGESIALQFKTEQPLPACPDINSLFALSGY